MDFIFTITGAICIVEAVLMFMGRDMMIFNDTNIKREDYDMDRLSKVEGVLFLIDGLGCLAIGMIRPAFTVQMVLLGIMLITLMYHGRNFSSDKYRIKKKK